MYTSFRPGQVWLDTEGKRIQAHGGSVFYEDGSFPTYVNSIALGPDGNVYTLARFLHEGHEIEDLIKIKLNYK